MLYEAQFPVGGCAGRKFMVAYQNAGLGSIVHVGTYFLALALDEGRIFLWSNATGAEYAVDACGEEKSVLCFFRAPSSCTLADTVGADVRTMVTWSGTEVVPHVALAILNSSAAPQTAWQLTYAWRAHAAAFLARFNSRALASMRKMRLAPHALATAHAPTHVGAAWAATLTTFPLAPGVTSISVRSGDKAREMTLVPLKEYFAAAEARVMVANPWAHVRGGLIASIPADANLQGLAAALARGEDAVGNGTLPSSYERAALSTWAWTWLAPQTSAGQGTDAWWLQLLLALECDAWVGTLGSNWNRLIDELRAVWLPKARNVFVEVGDDGGGTYFWRARALAAESNSRGEDPGDLGSS